MWPSIHQRNFFLMRFVIYILWLIARMGLNWLCIAIFKLFLLYFFGVLVLWVSSSVLVAPILRCCVVEKLWTWLLLMAIISGWQLVPGLTSRAYRLLSSLHTWPNLLHYWLFAFIDPSLMDPASSHDLLITSGWGAPCILSLFKDCLNFSWSFALREHLILSAALLLTLYKFTDIIQYNIHMKSCIYINFISLNQRILRCLDMYFCAF